MVNYKKVNKVNLWFHEWFVCGKLQKHHEVYKKFIQVNKAVFLVDFV